MTTRNMKTVVPSPNLIIRKMVLLALLLPPSYQPLLAAENAPEWIYSVRPKDTLIHFAKRYLVNPQDWRILQQLIKFKTHTAYQLPPNCVFLCPWLSNRQRRPSLSRR